MKIPKKKVENDDSINDLESNLDEPITKKPSVNDDDDDDDFDDLDDLGFEDIDSLEDDDDEF